MFDSFNRADNPSSMGDTDTGQTWVPNLGTWGIVGNEAYCIGVGQYTTVIETGVSDCTVSVVTNALGSPGPCWRSTNDSNYWIGAGGTIYKRVAGAFTVMGTIPFVAGDTISVTVSGPTHVVKVNGVPQLTIPSDSFNETATKHGLRSQAGTSRFDTFSVDVP